MTAVDDWRWGTPGLGATTLSPNQTRRKDARSPPTPLLEEDAKKAEQPAAPAGAGRVVSCLLSSLFSFAGWVGEWATTYGRDVRSHVHGTPLDLPHGLPALDLTNGLPAHQERCSAAYCYLTTEEHSDAIGLTTAHPYPMEEHPSTQSSHSVKPHDLGPDEEWLLFKRNALPGAKPICKPLALLLAENEHDSWEAEQVLVKIRAMGYDGPTRLSFGTGNSPDAPRSPLSQGMSSPHRVSEDAA